MTLLSAPARYWLLCEGTPGGELGDDDLCGRSDGRVASCSIAWQEDIVNNSGVATGMEWVYFADGTLERSLVLLHDDDDVTDCYRRMDGMTVFEFGRADRSHVGPSLLACLKSGPTSTTTGGWLNLHHSVTRSAYGNIMIPIAVVSNGRGPTALFMAGNHGDEYEGQIALCRLIASWSPARSRAG